MLNALVEAILAITAGVLIFLVPGLLNYLAAAYLIVVGMAGLIGLLVDRSSHVTAGRRRPAILLSQVGASLEQPNP